MGKTNQFDYLGKYWIMSDSRVLDCSDDEHARYALAAIKGIDPFDKVAVHGSVPLDGVFKAHVLAGDKIVLVGDPRVWAIKAGWIRVAENKFYAQEWDLDALQVLLKSKDFWKKQTKVTDSSWIEFYDVPRGLAFEGPTGKWFALETLRKGVE